MSERAVADRLTLISEAEVVGHGALILSTPVLVQTGQTFWVDVAASELVVEDALGHQRRFSGAYETRCY